MNKEVHSVETAGVKTRVKGRDLPSVFRVEPSSSLVQNYIKLDNIIATHLTLMSSNLAQYTGVINVRQIVFILSGFMLLLVCV